MTTYLDLIKAINARPRQPAACTPDVVEVVRAGGEDVQLLVNATLAWEIGAERRAGPGDEAEVLARRDQLVANMEAARARG
ncbi:hypothetical protein [Azospirillum canadense]|uniref:hypothetical protein n=1 Tax=Azospirillum canadense TaxID=403962 RepID=UPI00222765E4|nr:hypothetical protein [Azospirillum canadense]MCW2239240.1 hypothetical protein [Azospirillum canadense]